MPIDDVESKVKGFIIWRRPLGLRRPDFITYDAPAFSWTCRGVRGVVQEVPPRTRRHRFRRIYDWSDDRQQAPQRTD